MTIRERLDEIVASKNLLEHPFYQAWSNGTLPVPALKTYAEEYGAFIRTISKGWAAHGDTAIAAEEDNHAELWQEFAGALGTKIGDEAKVPEVKALVDAANRNFDNVAESMGGLYAFEAQQPHTSTSKLKGLQDHYQQLPIEAHPYFAVHCDDVHEMALLAERIQALPVEEQEKAIAACREVADALWNALSGICHVHEISC